MDNNRANDVLKEAEEVAELGVRKSQIREAGKELYIPVRQVEVAIKNMERVAEMVKSPEGKCKVIGVDKFDYSDWVKAECDTPKEAIKLAEELTTKAKRSATSKDIATVYYAYDPEGNYIGGDTWRQGEKGGLALTDEEESLVIFLRKIPFLSLSLACKAVTNPLPGSRQDIPWFHCPILKISTHTIYEVFLAIVEETPWWYHKRSDGTFKMIHVDFSAPKEEVRKFLNNSHG